MTKPRVFIGSSVEGLPAAEHIQLGLDYHAECTIWHQGVFGLSEGTLEAICRTARDFDFAILVLTPDDLVHKRGEAKNSPRDNVLFELGLFMGALGRERTFITYCRDESIDLPTDLAGVTAAKYARRADRNLQAAVGPVCTQIRNAIAIIEQQKELRATNSSDEAIKKLSSELEALKLSFSEQSKYVRRMIGSLTANPSSGDSRTGKLHFMEGAWKEVDSGSMAYGRLINGQIKFIYSYAGADIPTGEYYNIRVIGDAFLARFRWFDGSFEGYSYLEKEDTSILRGGWWLSEDVPMNAPIQIPNAKKRVATKWIRQKPGRALPAWAEAYFITEQEKIKTLQLKKLKK